MPVYVRKQRDSIDLSKFEEKELEIDSDFILDPDKFRDELPQPYRFIDKVLESLIEVAFQEIFKREEERQTEESRYKPPIVPVDLFRQVKDVSDVKFLTHSHDERFVFCSAVNKLLALGAVSMETMAKFESPDLEISFMSVARVKKDFYLLATLDEVGTARLFIFDSTNFQLAKVLNEEEGEKKLICIELQLSECGEFVALTLQNSSTKQVQLDFMRLPLDAWAKEVEQQTDKQQQKPAAVIAEEAEAAADEADDAASVGNSDDAGSRQQQQQTLKMSPPTAVLRVKPLPEVASTSSSPNFKAVDTSGDVIGSGSAHLLTQSHLLLREAHFRRLHQREFMMLPKDSCDVQAVVPTAHVTFLRSGRSIGQDSQSETRTCAACVAWAGDHRIVNYSLARAGKDLELKPESVWPFASAISALSASNCKSQLAIGLENGNVCLLDARIGLLRHVISVSSSQPIRKLLYLNPAAFADSFGDHIYRTREPIKLLAFTSDWSAKLLESAPDTELQSRDLPTSARQESEAAQLVQHTSSHPTLLLRSARNGAIVLHDITVPQDVLQFVLPSPWQLAEPWQASGWTLAANGGSLVIRGVSGETGEDALFSCNLRILIPMKHYWSRQLPQAACFVQNSLLQRVDAFLLNRAKTHSQRQQSLAEIWSKLSETLSEVQAAARAEEEPPQSVRSIHTSMSAHSDEQRMDKLQHVLHQESGASA